MRVSGSFLAKLALSVWSSLLCCLVIEAGLRISDGIPIFSARNFVQDDVRVSREHGWGRYDSELGWRLRDHYSSDEIGGRIRSVDENGDVEFREASFKATVTTGDFGIRMNSAERRPAPQHSILAVGDSFTAGSGVSDHESWPAQLESRLEHPVLNAASPGWGVDQMLIRAEQLIPKLEPRTLIIGILDDDIHRTAHEVLWGKYKPYYVVAEDGLSLRGVPAPEITSGAKDLGALRSILGHSYLVHWTVVRLGLGVRWTEGLKFRRTGQGGVEISCRLMQRAAAFRSESDLRVLVAFLYRKEIIAAGDSPPESVRSVKSCAEREGLETVDLFPRLREFWAQSPEEFDSIWLSHGHMTAEGNQLVADSIHEAFFETPSVSCGDVNCQEP